MIPVITVPNSSSGDICPQSGGPPSSAIFSRENRKGVDKLHLLLNAFWSPYIFMNLSLYFAACEF